MILKSGSRFVLKHLTAIAAIELCLINCAVQRAPTGGPVDKTPPRVLEVTPLKNATLVPLDAKPITLPFDLETIAGVRRDEKGSLEGLAIHGFAK